MQYNQVYRVSTTAVTSGVPSTQAAVLQRVIVEASHVAAILVYNGTTVGTQVLNLQSAPSGSYELGIWCNAGIYVEKNAAHDIVVVYTPHSMAAW